MRLIHLLLSQRDGNRREPAIAPQRALRPASRRTCEKRPGSSRGWVRGRQLVMGAAVVMLCLSAASTRAESDQVLALAGSIDQVLSNIRNWIMGILAGLATVFLSIGGVRYVMGAGDPGEIEKAKTSFRAAGVGYTLAALAPLIVSVLKGIVGA